MEYELKKKGGFKYIEEGKGETLLLLHGLFGALSNWREVIETFKDRYTVVIPMLPIYDSVFKLPTVSDLAGFVDQFVKKMDYKNPIVIGNSLGGHVALVYAIDYSSNYKALVLTGSSGLFENSMGGTFPKRGDYDYIKERTAYTFYSPETATKELVDEVFDIVNDRIKVLKIINMSKSAMRHNLKEDLAKITKPALLVWGKNDNITPPHVAEEFKKGLVNSELYWIDKCGHAPMMEQPIEFNEILDRFLLKIYKTN